jgi:hypothetical protein
VITVSLITSMAFMIASYVEATLGPRTTVVLDLRQMAP